MHTQLRVGRSVLASHGFAIRQSDSVLVLCTVLLSTSLYNMRPLSDKGLFTYDVSQKTCVLSLMNCFPCSFGLNIYLFVLAKIHGAFDFVFCSMTPGSSEPRIFRDTRNKSLGLCLDSTKPKMKVSVSVSIPRDPK